MKRTGFRLRLCFALLAANLVFIWGNSAMPAEVSDAFSRWVHEILRALFPGEAGAAGEGHGLLRKLAHFSEFACLGALLAWLLGMLGGPGSYLPCFALPGGFLTACVDESIQLLVPGRSAGLTDVGIDTAGAAVGMCLLLLGHYLLCKSIVNKT